MPWKETRPRDERVQFMGDLSSCRYSRTELCRIFEISRKTKYKWARRYGEEGQGSLGPPPGQPPPWRSSITNHFRLTGSNDKKCRNGPPLGLTDAAFNAQISAITNGRGVFHLSESRGGQHGVAMV